MRIGYRKIEKKKLNLGSAFQIIGGEYRSRTGDLLPASKRIDTKNKIKTIYN